MKRLFTALALPLTLAACSTAEVQHYCAETEHAVWVGKPFLDFAPSYVQLAAGAIGAGAHVCGTPEYAAAREQVLTWLRSKGGDLYR